MNWNHRDLAPAIAQDFIQKGEVTHVGRVLR
jgi:hypothetical protein